MTKILITNISVSQKYRGNLSLSQCNHVSTNSVDRYMLTPWKVETKQVANTRNCVIAKDRRVCPGSVVQLLINHTSSSINVYRLEFTTHLALVFWEQLLANLIFSPELWTPILESRRSRFDIVNLFIYLRVLALSNLLLSLLSIWGH